MNFVVFYISDKNKKTVTVIRVVYGGRDIKSFMRIIQTLKKSI